MKITEPTISYVFISYNAVSKMIAAINQLKEHEKETWHCIILDNGSDDDTGFQARKMVDADPRIRYVYQQKQSIEIARSNAMELCLSDNVRFLEIE